MACTCSLRVHALGIYTHAMFLHVGVFNSGGVWPRDSRGSVEFFWRKGNFNSLSLDEQTKLTEDLVRNDRKKYGITPPPTGWTAALFAALDTRERPREFDCVMTGGPRRVSGRHLEAAALASAAAAAPALRVSLSPRATPSARSRTFSTGGRAGNKSKKKTGFWRARTSRLLWTLTFGSMSGSCSPFGRSFVRRQAGSSGTPSSARRSGRVRL